MKQQTNKLWGTAFSNAPNEQAVLFAAGRDVVGLPPADEALIPYEIQASTAHLKALFDVGLIDAATKDALLKGLIKLQKEYEAGTFTLDPSKEDVHTNIESWLTEQLGIKIAGQIHTGRSRNEQCVADEVLYLKATNAVYISEILHLIVSLNKAAKKYKNTVIPGYTHHQHATVTTFGNMLHAYVTEFEKDIAHMESWNKLEEVSALGAGAGYGSTLPVDKKKVNGYAGFQHVFSNEIAVITFRGDAEMTFVFHIALFMNHLSSLAQTLIEFSTKEFGFVTISDEYSTGSSIMPQKKNPDPLEVMKAKASMCHGYLMSLLSLTKAPFIGFNRDSQWIKYVVHDVIDETKLASVIMSGVINTLSVHSDVMASWTTHGHIYAQAIMEGLISSFYIPMRQAKIVLETAIKNTGPQGNLTRKVINLALKNKGFVQKVKPDQFAVWINPLSIAQKQMKKEIV